MKKNRTSLILGWFTAVCSVIILAGCGAAPEKACRIHGTMESGQWDGKKIYLVPMMGKVDASRVDSTIVKDGKFELSTDSCEMKRITLEIAARYGTQDLLVVTEPGDIQVSIGKNSRAFGTPQNDSLQVWKDQLMKYSSMFGLLSKQERATDNASLVGQKNQELIRQKKQEVMRQMADYTEQMKERMPAGAFKSFLEKMYPSKK